MCQIRGFCLPFLLLVSAGLAFEAGTIRVSETVGDTIDTTERESYGLFPGVPEFRDARFLLGPDSTVQAVVTTGEPGATVAVTYRLSSLQFERIRFLVTNSDYVSDLTAQNPDAAQAVRRFWTDIERTGVADRLALSEGPPPDESGNPSCLGKGITTLTGATLGSAVGGWLATEVATKKVADGYEVPAKKEYWSSCSDGDPNPCSEDYLPQWVPAKYNTNWAAYYGTYLGVTALGAGVGYVVGRQGHSELRGEDSPKETHGCDKCLPCLTAVPGAILGALFVNWANGTLYGREDKAGYTIEGGNGAQLIPAVVTGVCIAVEVTVLGYQLGKAIDRNRAARRSRASYARSKASLPGARTAMESLGSSDTLSVGQPSRP